jgi:hypothetical protein
MPSEQGRRRPGGTSPRFMSSETYANALNVGHEALGFELGRVPHAAVLDRGLEGPACREVTARRSAGALAAPAQGFLTTGPTAAMSAPLMLAPDDRFGVDGFAEIWHGPTVTAQDDPPRLDVAPRQAHPVLRSPARTLTEQLTHRKANALAAPPETRETSTTTKVNGTTLHDCAHAGAEVSCPRAAEQLAAAAALRANAMAVMGYSALALEPVQPRENDPCAILRRDQEPALAYPGRAICASRRAHEYAPPDRHRAKWAAESVSRLQLAYRLPDVRGSAVADLHWLNRWRSHDLRSGQLITPELDAVRSLHLMGAGRREHRFSTSLVHRRNPASRTEIDACARESVCEELREVLAPESLDAH